MKLWGSWLGVRASRAGFLLAAVPLIVGAVASSASPKGGPPPASLEHDPATLIVRFKTETAASTGIAAQGDRSIAALGKGVRVVRIRGGKQAESRLAEYRRRTDVVYADLNFVVHASLAPPNDANFGMQWGLAAIHAVDAWSLYPGAYSTSDSTRIIPSVSRFRWGTKSSA